MFQRLLGPCLLLLVVVAPAATAAGPGATAARSCSLSAAEKGGTRPSTLGATYVYSLSATGVSCATAKGVVKSFNACRHKRGKGGRCTSRVKGYRCTESRTNGVGQYDSKTACRGGGKTIRFTYTQNT
jgi:hypothetical protein